MSLYSPRFVRVPPTVDPSIFPTRLRSKLGLIRSSVLLSVWKNTTNIFSYDNFRHISSLLWRSLGLMLRSLFFFNASKIVYVVRSHLPKLHCYADDSKLYFLFLTKAALLVKLWQLNQWKSVSGRSSIGCTPTN